MKRGLIGTGREEGEALPARETEGSLNTCHTFKGISTMPRKTQEFGTNER